MSFVILFGISGGELLILLLVVLLLFGPAKIPEIARMVGRGMKEVRKVQREINTEIHRYSSDIDRETKSMESDIREMTRETDKDEATGNKDRRNDEVSEHNQADDESDLNDGLPYPYSNEKKEK